MYIRELLLYSPSPLQLLPFYQDGLGLHPLLAEEEEIRFQVGHTLLRFVQRFEATPYHIAFNIPSDMGRSALRWLQGRQLTLLEHQGSPLVDYPSWNAQAIYFRDHDRNVLEFIARRNRMDVEGGSFHAGLLRGVSEVGMAVSDIEYTFERLNQLGEMPLYDGSFLHFCAAGDEEGLLILLDRNARSWFPANDPAFTSDFDLYGDFNFRFEGGEVRPLP